MILITGANGQLGTELSYLFKEKGIDYVGTDATELDITDEIAVEQFLQNLKPTYVFHCAAYTAVDKAEDVGKEICYKVNVEGSENIAKAAKNVNAKVIYISTDYVFDGTSYEMIAEDYPTNPLSIYGETKLLGEKAIQQYVEEYYIVRTSWVFGKYGNNFVYTMKKLAKERDELTIVDDQVGRPTWTRTLAEFLLHLVENNCEYGIYHLSNEGSCSWYEFACEILKDEDIKIKAVDSTQFVQKAKRPGYSVMS